MNIAQTGAGFPANLDGKSLVPLLTDPVQSLRSDFLIHHWIMPPISTTPIEEWGVRNDRWVDATRSNGLRFLYDLQNDPLQLNNLVDDADYTTVRSEMELRLEQLKPADRQAPVATEIWIESGPHHASGLRPLRLRATVSDATKGNSQVRTPEVLIQIHVHPGQGVPLDALDGRFDSTKEETFLDIPWTEFGIPVTVSLRFRDVPGNWSSPIAVSVSAATNGTFELAPESDTGTNRSDGKTLDATPLFRGTTAAPNSDIIHLLTVQSPTGTIQIQGTNGDDVIRVDAFPGETISLILHDQLVGGLATATDVVAEGIDGLDLIHVRGPLSSRLSGGGGNDQLAGGDLDNVLDGSLSDDLLFGGSGGDFRFGGIGNDRAASGPGNDNFWFGLARTCKQGPLVPRR